MKKTKSVFLFSLLFIWSIMTGNVAQASEFSFSVEPILPENQVSENLGYYDVVMQPGESQTLETRLRNATDRDVTVNVTMTTAKTNDNGIVEYGPNNIENHSSLAYPFEELVDYENKVVIPAKSELTYSFVVNMPDVAIPGIIPGGVSFQEETADEEESGEGLAIKNKFSFAVAVLLRQSNETGIGELELTEARASQRNVRNVIQGHFENAEPFYINDLAIDAAVYEEGSDEALYSQKTDNMQMASNSSFWYSLPLGGNRLEPGNYILRGTAYAVKNDDGEFVFVNDENETEERYQRSWEFEEPFEITREEARKYNEKDVEISEPESNNWVYYLIGIIVLLVLIIILLLFKRKNKDKE